MFDFRDMIKLSPYLTEKYSEVFPSQTLDKLASAVQTQIQ